MINELTTLREHYDPPGDRAVRKCIPYLDRHCRALIAASPFLVIASGSARGADASPRGDRPGFVRVLDDRTLLLPDRPGNNRLDTMENILADQRVGLLFFIPGMAEMLRVNGDATLTVDPDLLAPSTVDGRAPRSAIIVVVREAYLHCAKAVMRSRLWDSSCHVDRATFPSPGRIQADQIAGLDAARAEAEIAAHNRTMLY